MVCYKFAMDKCDQGDNCQYSHNIEEAKKWVMMKAKYYMDSKWYRPSPGDPPRLSLFMEADQEEQDWYKFQQMVLAEQLAVEELAEEEDYVEEYEEEEVVVSGYDAPYRS